MQSVDLTDFGFTPTETQAYLALVEAGPSSGYALAKRLSVARANAYQALNGLVTKEAAVVVDRDPTIFRAVAPPTLLARITRDQSARLDLLERALTRLGTAGEPAVVPFRGTAELEALALRTAVRAPTVSCFAPPELLRSLAPIWRARAANDRPTALYAIGEPSDPLPFTLQRQLPTAQVTERFGGEIAGLLTDAAGILVRLDLDAVEGFWFSDPLLLGTLRAALTALTP